MGVALASIARADGAENHLGLHLLDFLPPRPLGRGHGRGLRVRSRFQFRAGPAPRVASLDRTRTDGGIRGTAFQQSLWQFISVVPPTPGRIYAAVFYQLYQIPAIAVLPV